MSDPAPPMQWDDFAFWAPDHLTGGLDDPVGVLAGMWGEPDDDATGTVYARVSRELEPVTGARVTAKHIDPSVGAGSFGIAAFWQVVSQGADLIAWVTIAVQAAPRLRAAARKLAGLLGHRSAKPSVSFSPAAIRMLVVADVIGRNHLDPSAVVDVQMLRHTLQSEPREELRQLLAAYTVSVSAFAEEAYCTWVYVVTPKGEIASEGKVRIAIPNRSPVPSDDGGGRSLAE